MEKEPVNGLYFRFKALVLKTTPVLFIALCLSVSPFTTSASARIYAGLVLSATGEVYLYHEDESLGIVVTVQESVYSGDVIVTGEGSVSKIRLKDESVLSMGENSRLRMKEYLLLEEEAKRVAVFELRSGRLLAQMSEGFDGNGSSFQIVTPSAIVTAMGADFMVSMTDKGTEVVALEGVVFVKSASTAIAGEVVLNEGFGITIQTAWVLPEPVSVPEAELKAIIDETHVEETLTPAPVPEDETVASCVTCHQRTYLTMVRQKFVHPGAERDCKRCHIKQSEKVKEIPAEVYAMESLMMESLIFLDVEEKTTSTVRVRVKDRAGREAVSDEVSFATLTFTEKIIDDEMPPIVTNLRVEELRGGVFYTAVVAWDTDKPCKSVVEWALPGAPVTRLSIGDQYAKDHRVAVSGLSEGRQYTLRVISKDPFGNTAGSEDLTVETSRLFSKEIEEPDEFPSVEEVSVVKVGEKTALRWKTNIETTAVVDLSSGITQETSDDPHFPGGVFTAALPGTATRVRSIKSCHIPPAPSHGRS
jgi:hypothetical protein